MPNYIQSKNYMSYIFTDYELWKFPRHASVHTDKPKST